MSTINPGVPPLSAPAALVRRYDRDRFLTALFAPAERREAVFSLYAFNHEIARIREMVSEELLGRIRLQWWRQGLDAVAADAAVRHHEIMEPLAEAIRRFGLSRAHFDRLIEARERDLSGESPRTLPALEAYAEESSSPLLLLTLEALGVGDPAAIRAARETGIAYALAGLMRAVPFHASQRRSYLPQALVEETGLDSESVVAGRSSAALQEIVRRIAERAEAHLTEARRLRGAVPRAALPALLPATLAAADLKHLRRAEYDPFRLRPDPHRGWRLTIAALTGRY